MKLAGFILSFLVVFNLNTISPAYAEPALLLYANDKQFLGCINCTKYDQVSIWNEYGTYGSKYNIHSIWNKYGQYGGQYSIMSPFNAYTTNPPKILDQQGNFYGYLTSNKYLSQRADTTRLILAIFAKSQED